jgi:hypothetical protein
MKDRLLNMTYSFSRLETFERCPYAFYLRYIKEVDCADSFFAQYGSFHHKIMEKYLKGELLLFELSSYYKENFDDEITSPAMPIKNGDLRDNYYYDGLNYYNNFSGLNDTILGVENDRYTFDVDKYKFNGVIDVETDNKIIDHKTKSKQHVSRPAKNTSKDYIQLIDGRYVEFKNFIQLLLYCIPYKQRHGKYPEFLALNMLRINDWYEIKFDEALLDKAIAWVVNIIETICNTTDFPKGNDVGDLWCNEVCSTRYDCPYSQRFMGV